MNKKFNTPDKSTGVTLWRQVADQLRRDMDTIANDDGKFPIENDLASLFNVNRLTLRAAVSALVEEGLLTRQQGRGTFIKKQNRLRYPISKRTRFSTGLETQTTHTSVKVLEAATEQGADFQTSILGLKPNATLLRLETLATADKIPIIRTTSWFCAKRFAGLAEVAKETHSITKGLAGCGIHDYVRQSTDIEARYAEREDMIDLQLSGGGLVLRTTSTNADTSGKIIQYSVSRMAADRVVLNIDNRD